MCTHAEKSVEAEAARRHGLGVTEVRDRESSALCETAIERQGVAIHIHQSGSLC